MVHTIVVDGCNWKVSSDFSLQLGIDLRVCCMCMEYSLLGSLADSNWGNIGQEQWPEWWGKVVRKMQGCEIVPTRSSEIVAVQKIYDYSWHFYCKIEHLLHRESTFHISKQDQFGYARVYRTAVFTILDPVERSYGAESAGCCDCRKFPPEPTLSTITLNRIKNILVVLDYIFKENNKYVPDYRMSLMKSTAMRQQSSVCVCVRVCYVQEGSLKSSG